MATVNVIGKLQDDLARAHRATLRYEIENGQLRAKQAEKETEIKELKRLLLHIVGDELDRNGFEAYGTMVHEIILRHEVIEKAKKLLEE